MTTDIVERLRDLTWISQDPVDKLFHELMREAADEIERMQTALDYHVNELRSARRDIDRLRGAA